MPRSPVFTRRGLFRGLGTATVVAGCTRPPQQTGTEQPGATPGDSEQIGPGPSTLSFQLNGRSVTLEVEPRVTLLDALRNHLEATGPKEVCNRGACGACTVHVAGVPRNACMMLAHDVADMPVTTVEGLAQNKQLSRLQQAFVQRDAMQCGFCTSGMLMSASALLDRHRETNAPLTKEAVDHAMAGNLCRCGTYPHVVGAILEAGDGEQGGPDHG